jgi:hypothetical protein
MLFELHRSGRIFAENSSIDAVTTRKLQTHPVGEGLSHGPRGIEAAHGSHRTTHLTDRANAPGVCLPSDQVVVRWLIDHREEFLREGLPASHGAAHGADQLLEQRACDGIASPAVRDKVPRVRPSSDVWLIDYVT